MWFKKRSNGRTPVVDKHFAKKKVSSTTAAAPPAPATKVTAPKPMTTVSSTVHHHTASPEMASETRDNIIQTECPSEEDRDLVVDNPTSDRSGQLLEDAASAIRELKRILFFTDLPDGNSWEDTQLALEELDKVAAASKPYPLPPSKNTLSKPSSSTIAVVEILDVLKARMQYAISECKRIVLFTDLDEGAMSKETAGLDVFQEVKLLIEQVEKKYTRSCGEACTSG